MREPTQPPESVEEALARARAHARIAAAEATAAVHALLDAAALATSGVPSEAARWLAPLARVLDGLAADLDPRAEHTDSLLASIAEALDVEIARWESRSRDDTEARAVLRAFLGVRELLWEFGVRPPPGEGPPPPPRGRADPGPGPRPRQPRRVQRVRVEG